MNISLPEKTAKKLRKSVKPRERSAVIAEALDLYFERVKKENLMQELISGYKASAQLSEEDGDWLSADLGGNSEEY